MSAVFGFTIRFSNWLKSAFKLLGLMVTGGQCKLPIIHRDQNTCGVWFKTIFARLLEWSYLCKYFPRACVVSILMASARSEWKDLTQCRQTVFSTPAEHRHMEYKEKPWIADMGRFWTSVSRPQAVIIHKLTSKWPLREVKLTAKHGSHVSHFRLSTFWSNQVPI